MKTLVLFFFFSLLSFSLASDMSIISYDENHKTNWRTDDEVMALYEAWLVKHGKSYNALGEKDKRFEIFKDNLRYIDEQNGLANRTYKLGLNRFADLTNDEYRSMYLGTRTDAKWRFSRSHSNRLPDSTDWRDKGAVVPVKDQGSCALASLLRVSAEVTCDFPAVFNFGDSNSDTGGLSAAFGQARPPNGQTFFRRPAGRYCDGRLIIDFMTKDLGLPFLSAYLDALGSNFTHGANFATAGSTISPQNTTINELGNFSPFSLNVQHQQFDDFYSRSRLIRSQQGGIYKHITPKSEDFSRALYTFDMVQNDLGSAFFRNMTVDQVKDSIPELVDQFKSTIEDIYGHGGRSFWVHSTGPLGCLAYMLVRFPVTVAQIDRVGCAIPYNDVAQFYNRALKEAVVQLREELPEIAITYVDVYAIKYDLFSHAKQYGFRQSLGACCGYGGGKYNYNFDIGCGATRMVDGREVMVGKPCKDPSMAINWDGAHYTEAANKWVFDRIVEGSYSDPPIPLKMACCRQ